MNESLAELPAYFKGETEYLRERLSINIDETATLERYAIATTGALWVWIGTHQVTGIQMFDILNWLPLLLTMFLGFRCIAVYLRIKSIRAYLTKIEIFAKIPDGLDWVSLHEVSGARYRVLTASAFWSGINLVNLGIAIIAQKVPLDIIELK